MYSSKALLASSSAAWIFEFISSASFCTASRVLEISLLSESVNSPTAALIVSILRLSSAYSESSATISTFPFLMLTVLEATFTVFSETAFSITSLPANVICALAEISSIFDSSVELITRLCFVINFLIVVFVVLIVKFNPSLTIFSTTPPLIFNVKSEAPLETSASFTITFFASQSLSVAFFPFPTRTIVPPSTLSNVASSLTVM